MIRPLLILQQLLRTYTIAHEHEIHLAMPEAATIWGLGTGTGMGGNHTEEQRLADIVQCNRHESRWQVHLQLSC